MFSLPVHETLAKYYKQQNCVICTKSLPLTGSCGL